MIKNYFITAWRSLLRNSTFYFINIFGLSVGLTCCLLIGAYVYTELTYDRYPEHADQIYRVELHATGNGAVVDYPNVDWAVGEGISSAFPEVLAFTRVSRGWQLYMRYNETVLKETNLAMADSNFFQFFSIPLSAGDARTALTEPNSIVVTKAFAKKYFGDEDPLGKILSYSKGDGQFKVTGVIDQLPDKSHFHFDAFISLATIKPKLTWSNLAAYTYLQLTPNADPAALEAKFPALVAEHVVPEIQHDMGVSLAEAQKAVSTFVFSLQPLTRIHLYSHTGYEIEANSDIRYVYIFGSLAAFILLLACVNFINLATATSSKRAREVGIRKVMGSVKAQLIGQFLAESVMLAGAAMMIAYALTLLMLPYFNDLTGGHITFSLFTNPLTIAMALASLLGVGLAAGMYPAFFISSFKTISVLKGKLLQADGRRDNLRSALVIFQFGVSTALIIATLVVYRQLNFMQSKNLGYDKEQVLVIQDTYFLRKNESVFKEKLATDSRVISASVARQLPGFGNIDGTQAFPKDQAENESHAEIHIDIFHIDYAFLPTLGISLRNGRNLSPDFPSDSSGILINETAARELGWDPDKALNNSIVASGRREYHVVGVVKDFNYVSVRQKISPLVMMLSYNSGSTLVKLKTKDISSFLAEAKKQWNAFGVDAPFTYSFLDERFASLYASEERTGKVFTTFAVIAMLIAGLGLFGLTAYTAAQRTKEIGIRKVMGASVMQVLIMLSRQFLILVLISFVIAVPVVAWIMQVWLQDFAYRVDISWWIFAVAGALTLVIAFASMALQSLKAAVANPIQSLRSE
jgi:putative ABC transport system permease protein